MRLKIRHTTHYQFENPVLYGLQQLRLVPKSSSGQNVLSWSMEITGGVKQAEFIDHHQNVVSLISFDADAKSIIVRCEGEVETSDTAGINGKHAGFAPLWLFERPTDLTRAGPLVRRLIKGINSEADDAISRLHLLSAGSAMKWPMKLGKPRPKPQPKRHWPLAKACVRTMPRYLSRQPAH
jgi:transglutaminase-like putative cysteine protease